MARYRVTLTAEERAGLEEWAQKYVENSAYCLKNAARLSTISDKRA